MRKMNNKGFTLIELIAVIVLLAIVAGIGSYSVIQIINSAKEKDYDLLVGEIRDAVELNYQECKIADVDYSSNPCFMLGDANNDFVVNNIDAMLCLQYFKGEYQANIDYSVLGNRCNVYNVEEYDVTSADAELLLKYYVELESELNLGQVSTTLADLVEYGYLKGNGKNDDNTKTLVNPNTNVDISNCIIRYKYKDGKIVIEAAGGSGMTEEQLKSCPTTDDYNK